MELAVQKPEGGATDTDAKSHPLATESSLGEPLSATSHSNTNRFCSMYNLVRFACRVILNVFFVSIEVTGRNKVPEHGATIFVGNHSNQFVDALLLLTQLPRNISFLIAEKSLKRPIIGDFARILKCVSVTRAQDIAEKGVGKVKLVEPEAEVGGDGEAAVPDFVPPKTVLVTGSGTQFNTQAGLTVGAQLQIKVKTKVDPKETINVMVRMNKVLSDEQLEGVVMEEAQQAELPLSLGQADSRGEGDFKVLPKLDQQQMYNNVLDLLTDASGALGIFPEGGSHDRTQLLPLKPGVVIMAMVAEARGMPVNIIPCGINYFQGHVFRGGRVVIQIGTPVSATDDQRRRYTDISLPGDQQSRVKREVCAELLNQVEVGIKSVWLEAPQYQDLQMALVARKLFVPKGAKLPAEDFMELTRRFIQSIAALKGEHEDVQQGLEELQSYLTELRDLGLTDRDITEAASRRRLSWLATMVLFPMHIVIIVVLVPLGAPFMLLNLPLAGYIDCLARQEMKTALAGSDVKVKGFDVVASHKLKMGVVLYPIFYIVIAIAFYIWLALWRDQHYSWAITIVFWLLVWPLSFLSLIIWETALYSLRAIRYTMTFCNRQSPALQRLGEERRRMQVKLRELVKAHFQEAADKVGFTPTRQLLPIKKGGGKIKQLARLRGDMDATQSFATLGVRMDATSTAHLAHVEVL